MAEFFAWLVANWELVSGLAALVLAVVYAQAKGILAEKVLAVWGVVVAMASDVLASIPESDFETWAGMIYESLPTWAAAFTSVEGIKKALMRARDLLVESQADKARVAVVDGTLPSLRAAITMKINWVLT